MDDGSRWRYRGNEKCWDEHLGGDFSFVNCCTVAPGSGNLRHLQKGTQLGYVLKLPAIERRLYLFQMIVIQRWFAISNNATVPPLKQQSLLWRTGYFAARFLSEYAFPFPPAGRRFLEIAGGTGLPSLTALALGFAVTTSDVDADAAKFVSLSVYATFGTDSNEAKRFDTMGLDLLEWDRPTVEKKYDVIFGTNLVFLRDDLELYARVVKNLCRVYLNPGGVLMLVEDVQLMRAPIVLDEFTSHGFKVSFLETTPSVYHTKQRGALIYVSLTLPYD